LADSQGYYLVDDLKGWNIAIKVTISSRGEFLDPSTKPSPAEIALNAQQHADAVAKMVNLGDWSVERLYLDLTSECNAIRFGHPCFLALTLAAASLALILTPLLFPFQLHLPANLTGLIHGPELRNSGTGRTRTRVLPFF